LLPIAVPGCSRVSEPGGTDEDLESFLFVVAKGHMAATRELRLLSLLRRRCFQGRSGSSRPKGICLLLCNNVRNGSRNGYMECRILREGATSSD
jgi:hypothetical protein